MAIALAMVFLVPFIHQSIVSIWFYANYTYLVEEVCEQRDNPNNCCHASCVLKKELPAKEENCPSSPTQEWRCSLFVVPAIIALFFVDSTDQEIPSPYFCAWRTPILDQPEWPPSLL